MCSRVLRVAPRNPASRRFPSSGGLAYQPDRRKRICRRATLTACAPQRALLLLRMLSGVTQLSLFGDTRCADARALPPVPPEEQQASPSTYASSSLEGSLESHRQVRRMPLAKAPWSRTREANLARRARAKSPPAAPRLVLEDILMATLILHVLFGSWLWWGWKRTLVFAVFAGWGGIAVYIAFFVYSPWLPRRPKERPSCRQPSFDTTSQHS